MGRKRIDTGQTLGENRAYMRGYNNGRARAWKAHEKERQIAKSWREKAREGMGGARCDQCIFWERGRPTTKWGICNQDWKASPDAGAAWAQSSGGDSQLTTHDNFACINFMREATER